MVRWFLLLVVLGACSSNNPVEGDGGTDATTDAPSSDGAPLQTSAMSIDTPSDEQGASITGDGLTLFFSSDRAGTAGGRDIWVATRATTSDAFASPTRVAELDTASNENAPYVMPDGLISSRPRPS